MTTCNSTGPLHCLALLQVRLQLADIVAVDRPVIVEAKLLEEHPADKPGLDGVFDLVQEAIHRVADDRHADDHLLDFGLDARIKRVGANAVERIGQAAHAGADRHLVVVEHDDELLLQAAGMAEGLQDDTGAKGPVADHRHGMAVFVRPQQVVGRAQAGDATRGQPAWPVRKGRIRFPPG